jgi:hypothetical protein
LLFWSSSRSASAVSAAAFSLLHSTCRLKAA